MPFLFLSPSTQYYNDYATTGNERYWMNRIADAMEPYLTASGINFTRNNPEGNASLSIRMSNAGNYDFHLALHSNAVDGALAGKLRGIDAYCYPGSTDARRMADLIVAALKEIYPLPDKVQVRESTAIGELRLVRVPSVLVEIGYHDNPDDADWVTGHIDDIAAQLSSAVAAYFGLPFLRPGTERPGAVDVRSGYLNLRNGPSATFAPIMPLPDGAAVTVLSEYNGWDVVRYGDVVGYADGRYIKLT
jgi:N-acetylmuramoyl-L-alanine amidase